MTLVCGIPNAGKTTYSSKYSHVIHMDDLTLPDKMGQVIRAIKENNDICIDGIYSKAAERKKLINASEGKNVCIWLDTNPNLCKGERNTCHHPSFLIDIFEENFEAPTYDEGWDEIIIIKS